MRATKVLAVALMIVTTFGTACDREGAGGAATASKGKKQPSTRPTGDCRR